MVDRDFKFKAAETSVGYVVGLPIFFVPVGAIEMSLIFLGFYTVFYHAFEKVFKRPTAVDRDFGFKAAETSVGYVVGLPIFFVPVGAIEMSLIFLGFYTVFYYAFEKVFHGPTTGATPPEVGGEDEYEDEFDEAYQNHRCVGCGGPLDDEDCCPECCAASGDY